MHDFIKNLGPGCLQGFRAMYVFTTLSALLVFSLELVTHIEGKTEWTTLLTATIGGLLALLGTIVNHEFGSSKERAQAQRAADGPPNASAVTSTEIKSTTVSSSQTGDKP